MSIDVDSKKHNCFGIGMINGLSMLVGGSRHRRLDRKFGRSGYELLCVRGVC